MPQGWNRYAYVRNNPIGFLDPDGRVAVGFTGFTGPWSDSAVRDMALALQASGALGPVKVFSSERTDLAFAFVLRALSDDPQQPVVVFGHSWGGDAALALAKLLDKYNRPVHVLGIIDAQGKWFSFADKVRQVPPNVHFALNYYQKQEFLGGTLLVGEEGTSDILNILVKSSHTGMDEAIMDHFINLLLSGKIAAVPF